MYAIQRIDHQASHTHSWLVRIQRRRQNYAKRFSDGRYGGKSKALRAAQRYRDDLLAQLTPLTRRENCLIRKKSNRSGLSGLTRIATWEQSRGRCWQRLCWEAQWPDETGRPTHKKFSIRKYGERQAFRLALRARQQGLRKLKTTPFPHKKGLHKP